MSKKLRENSEETKLKKFSGITLISLVITIVILIILASIGIYLGLSDNGIFNRAKQAKENTNKQTATEIINLKITTAQMNKYAEAQRMPTLKELSLILKEDDEIEYVTERTQIASTKYEVGENPTSIFTRLKEYPYEFEINSSLQLASINGVKLIGSNQGKINSQVLWENPDINATEFPEQTITLNDSLSNYKCIKVILKNCSTDAAVIQNKVSSCIFVTSYNSFWGHPLDYRYFSGEDKKIKFDAGYTSGSASNNTLNNTTNIPIYIIGYNF